MQVVCTDGNTYFPAPAQADTASSAARFSSGDSGVQPPTQAVSPDQRCFHMAVQGESVVGGDL
jgi:hypothetical protein